MNAADTPPPPVSRPELAGIARHLPVPRAGSVLADLSDSTNAWGPSPEAARAAREAARDVAAYPTPYGSELKAALAAYHQVRPEEVVTGCGSDDVIRCAFAAFGAPGAVITWMEPTFVMIPVFARVLGLEARPVRFGPSFDVDAAALLAERAAMTYLCSPNNPTGTRAGREAVARLLEEAEGLVVMDEAYADFSGESWIADARAGRRLLVTRTFSKSFGLAGLRAGYGIASPDVVEAIEKVRGPFALSLVAERAATAAIGGDLKWMRDHAREAVSNRERLDETLRRQGYAPLASGANFLTVPVRDGMAVADACARRGVIVRGFRALPVVGDAVRVAMAPWPVLEHVVAAFDEVPR
ncbi:MAG: histidinol-phosphate aminotransferase family protein [Gemmatimonadetes bacterium]|nr:histidinol-phosphate aminotransferase family protein [Gemmatimonadota bacterium]